MTRREHRKRADRREETLTAAMEIVIQEGADALTIARLAGRLEAAVGALYRYFPGKEALVVALQVRALGELRAALEADLARCEAALGRARRVAPGEAALARLLAVTLGYAAEAERAPGRHRLIDAFLSAPTPVLDEAGAREVDAVLQPLLGLIERLLADAAASGALGPGDARLRTHLLWAALHGLDHLRKRDRLQPAALRVPALVREMLVSLLAGWGASARAVERALELATR